MRRWILGIISFSFWLLLVAGGYVAYEAYSFLKTPGSETPQELVLAIAPGATFDRVAWDLKKAGAITDVTRFRLLAYSKSALGRIKAGEYQINTGWTPEQVLWQITEGRSMLYRLSVREGLPWWETARAVAAQGFATYEDFEAVIHDPEFLRAHHIPFANAEGFLYPETYLLKKPRAPLDREQARRVASAMIAMFWKKNDALWRELPRKAGSAPIAAATPQNNASTPASSPRNSTAATPPTDSTLPPVPPHAPSDSMDPSAPNSRVTPSDIDPVALKYLIVLASLVEKETGVPAERGAVAGVYANRLRLNMLLQCDPTIIYGVGPSFSGAIRRSQLDDPKNLYNTYQHAGLPPGPICSPGQASLRAAYQPEQHDYLYFVATGVDAGHTFSKTLAEHNKAVQVYRARMRARQQ